MVSKLNALFRRYAFAVALLVLGVITGAVRADGVVGLPDTGVDVASLITAGITKLGTVALVAVGGAIAFMVVRKAISWARTMA